MSKIIWKGKERPDTPALRVAILFGGQSALAQALDKPVSTVQRWLETGLIPARYQGEILAVAAVRQIALDPATFVPAPSPALPATGASAL